MLERRRLVGAFRHPGHGFALVPCVVEVRQDPLTGHSARVLEGSRLMPAADFDLSPVAEEARASCPFCPERLEQMTPRLRDEITPEGRIRRGEAVLFPNLLPYAKHSSVSVYSPDRHLLPLAEMTPRLVADNLATQVEFERAVMRHDPESVWASISANHMLPSGSSLFHPHLQGSVDPLPMTMQRLLTAVPREHFEAYLDAEREAGERHLGWSGRVEWLASFAPLAPGELRAFIAEVASPAELVADLVEELGGGIATALNLYAEMGYESFNLAIYGAPPGTVGYPLNLRIACRSNLRPLYRSDSTYLERLHWEAAVDVTPEEVAEWAGDRFRR